MIRTYYGTNKLNAITYLEFGSIEIYKGKKYIWEFKLHDKAYDWFMLARYANDLISYLKMTEMLKSGSIEKIFRIYKTEIHHQNDASLNLAKICALSVMSGKSNKRLSFFELGQTIFGCIEGMDFYQKLIKYFNLEWLNIDLGKVFWLGVDISEFFNRLSLLLHQNYFLKTMPDTRFLPQNTDVFFAKGVTLLYAIRTEQQLIDLLEKNRLCIFDYSFSAKKFQDITIDTGKAVRYIEFDSFYSKYKKLKKKMYVRKNKSFYSKTTDRIFVDSIYGEEGLCKEFIKLDINIRKKLSLKLSPMQNGLILLDLQKNESVEWIELRDFFNSMDIK